MSLLGVKLTCPFATHTSAYDPKRTWRGHWNLRKIEHRADHILSGADFAVFIVIDDKGNDVFKDLNLG